MMSQENNDSSQHKVILTQRPLFKIDESDPREYEVSSVSLSVNSDDGRSFREQQMITIREYAAFCFGFSLSTSPIMAVFVLTPAIVGNLFIGGISNALFCFGYVLGSLSIAQLLIKRFGCKKAFLCGHFGGLSYFLVLLYAILYQGERFLPLGSFLGGVFQSIM
jgi:hypothetical protein